MKIKAVVHLVGAAGSGLASKFDIQHLIHTGLEPGDRWLGEIRETVLTVSSLPGPLSVEHETVTSQPRLTNR